MRGSSCTRLWELEPYREGRLGTKDARSFERHLETCSVCRDQQQRDERLRELARALPHEDPSELALRRLRARVLRDAATGVAPRVAPSRGRAHTAIAAVALVAVAACLLLFLRRGGPEGQALTTTAALPSASVATPPPETMAGAVAASAGARWSQSRADGLERIVLDDGALRIHVRPQRIGERFLVSMPDGELEVRGTTFEVAVADGVTTQVHVEEGVVELRLVGRPVQRLGATDTWTAAATPPAPPASAPTSSARPLSLAPVPPAQDAAAYAAAVTLLRSGRNDEAAASFHAFALAQPHSAQAEDASFLEAVALARAGRVDAAALAAEHHLASYPGSFHREEASVLVARAAAQRGDCGRARTVLAPWVGAPGDKADPDVLGALRPCQGR